MHGERTERRGQRDVQADGAARTCARDILQRRDLIAADRRTYHHYRSRIETAALDQIADGAVDAGTDPVIVGAQPDAARRRFSHSAAVRSGSLSPAFASERSSLCSATQYIGRAFSSERILAMYSPSTPIMISCTPQMVIRPTTSEG